MTLSSTCQEERHRRSRSQTFDDICHQGTNLEEAGAERHIHMTSTDHLCQAKAAENAPRPLASLHRDALWYHTTKTSPVNDSALVAEQSEYQSQTLSKLSRWGTSHFLSSANLLPRVVKSPCTASTSDASSVHRATTASRPPYLGSSNQLTRQ